MILNLVDRCFEGSECSTCYAHLPENLTWDRSCKSDSFTVYTNYDAFLSKVTDPSRSVAWLFESIEVMPWLFIGAPAIMDKFKYIYTYYWPLINTFPEKFKFIPAMGSWLASYEETRGFKKTKLLSMICSAKQNTQSQVMRHKLAEYLAANNKADVFGPEFRPLADKVDALKDYKFSIIIENGLQPGYFTEKLLDCLMTNTVPIYYGDPCFDRIANLYGIDMAGIIPYKEWVKNPDMLEDFLKNPELEAIIRNNRKAVEYNLAETSEIGIFRHLALDSRH